MGRQRGSQLRSGNARLPSEQQDAKPVGSVTGMRRVKHGEILVKPNDAVKDGRQEM